MHITDIFQSRKYRAVLRAYTFMTDGGRIWTMPSPFAMSGVESTTAVNRLRLVQFGSVTVFYNNIVEVSINASKDAATSITLRMPYESNVSKYGTGTHAVQELQVLKPQTFVDGDKYFITPSLFKGSYLYRLDIVPRDAIDWSASEASIRQAINSLSDKETYFMYLTDSTVTRTTTEKYMNLSFVDTSYLFQMNMNISYPEQTMYEKLFKTGKDAELLSLLQSNGVYPPVWDGWTLPNLLLALMHYAGMLPPDWESVSAINKSEYVEYKVYWDVYEAVVLRLYGELNSLRLPYSPEYPNPDNTLSDGYYFKTNPYDTISNMLENLMQTLGVNWRIDPATGILQVFFDSNNIVHEGTLSESLMSSFGYNYNDANLRNAVTVLGQEYGAGKMYSAYVQNNTSIRHFGRRHMVFQHPLILSDSQAEAVASNILNQYAFNVGSLNIDTLYAFRLNPYNRLNVKLSDDNITMGTGSTPLLEVDSISKNIDWLGKGTSRLSLINIVKKVYIPLEELFGGREIQIDDLSKFKFTWNSSLSLVDIETLITENIVHIPVGKKIRVAWKYGRNYKLRIFDYIGESYCWDLIDTKTFYQNDTMGCKIIEKDIRAFYTPNEDTWTGFNKVGIMESNFSELCSADGTGTHTSIKYLQVSKDDLYSEGVFNYTISLNYSLTYSGISDRLRRPVLAFVAIPLLNFYIVTGELMYDMRSLPSDSYRYALLQEVVFKLDFWKKNLDKAPVNLTELPFPEWAGVNLDVGSSISFKANTWFSCQGVFNDQQTVAFNLLCEKKGDDALLISRKFLLVAFIQAWDSNIKQYRWVPIGDYILINVPSPSKGLTLYWDGDKFKLSVFENVSFFGNNDKFKVLSNSSHSTSSTEGSYVYNYIKDNCIVENDRWNTIDSEILGKNVFDYKLKYTADIPYRLSVLVLKYKYTGWGPWKHRVLNWKYNRLELVRLDLSPTQDYKNIEVTLGDLDYNNFAELSGTEPNVFTLTFVASPFQYYDAHFYLDNGYSLMQRSAVTQGSEPSEDTNTYPAYFWVKDAIISDSRKHVAGVTGFNFN